MPSLTLSGFDELDAAFSRIEDIPKSLKEDMLKAMATVGAAKIRATGEAMGVRDPQSSEHILDSMKLGKPVITETGGYILVKFSGTRHRGGTNTRNTEIAFLNEYGARGNQARPFIRDALDRYEDAITDPGADSFWDWFSKTFEE